MGNSVNEPRLDWDQRVIKSAKAASQTNLLAWYFQLSEFHNIPTQESLFQKQTWPASPLLCRQWRHSFLFFCNLFILLLAALGLCCCTGFSLSPCGERRFLLQFDGFSLWCLLLLQSTGSRSCSPGLQSAGSLVVTHRLIALQHVGSSWIREAPSGDIPKTILEEFSSINLVLERPVVPWMTGALDQFCL